jgi:hypothetical protein
MGDQAPIPPMKTPREDLAYLIKEGVSETTLIECRGLISMVFEELGVSQESVTLGRQANLLLEVLSRIADENRQQASAQRELRRDRAAATSCFQIAAAAELLRLTDEAAFEDFKQFRCGQFATTWTKLLENPDNRGEVAERQLRAAFWLGRMSSATGERFQRHVPRIFEVAIRKYLTNKDVHAELIARFAGNAGDTLGSSSKRTARRRPASLVNDPRYVRRDDLHERFRHLLSAGTKLILFVGQPGMGKSWLARAVVAEHASDPANVAVIRAQGNISKADLHTALTAAGMDADSVEFGDVAFHLARLVNDERAPEFVLIDGLDDAAILSKLLPPLTRSVIVATARFMSRHVGEMSIIEIGPMSADEAVEFMQRHLPNLSNDDADLLNQKIHGFPLVIHHACPLLASGTLSVAQLSQVLETNAPVFLADVTSEDNGKLVAVLGKIIVTIATTDPRAFHLLECLAFLQNGFKISQQFLTRYMSSSKELTPEIEAETALVYTQAVRRLQDFSLIEVLDADYLSMHHLTKLALRMLMSGRIAHVALSAEIGVGLAYKDRYVHELNALDPEDFWAHHKHIHDKMHLHDIFSAFLASSEEDRVRLGSSPEEAREQADLLELVATQFRQAVEQTSEMYLLLNQASQMNMQHPTIDELHAIMVGMRKIYPLATVRDFISLRFDAEAMVNDEAYRAEVLDDIDKVLNRARQSRGTSE